MKKTSIFVLFVSLLSATALSSPSKTEQLKQILQSKGAFESTKQTQEADVLFVKFRTDKELRKLLAGEEAWIISEFNRLELGEKADRLSDFLTLGDTHVDFAFGWEQKTIKNEILTFANPKTKKALSAILNDKNRDELNGFSAAYLGIKIYDTGSDLLGNAVYVILPYAEEGQDREAIVIRISYNQG